MARIAKDAAGDRCWVVGGVTGRSPRLRLIQASPMLFAGWYTWLNGHWILGPLIAAIGVAFAGYHRSVVLDRRARTIRERKWLLVYPLGRTDWTFDEAHGVSVSAEERKDSNDDAYEVHAVKVLMRGSPDLATGISTQDRVEAATCAYELAAFLDVPART